MVRRIISRGARRKRSVPLGSILADESALSSLADFFKVLGDSTRVKILSALLSKTLAAGDIAKALGMSASATSHQLRALKAGRLVKSRRAGRSLEYSVADSHVHAILRAGLDHILERSGEKEGSDGGRSR